LKKGFIISFVLLFGLFIIFSTFKGKSTLDTKHKEVTQSYFALKDPLQIRYEAIINAMNVAKTIGGDRDVISDTDKLFKEFQKKVGKKANLAEVIKIANQIEGNYSRLIKATELSPKLKNQEALIKAFENINKQSPRAYLIKDYQDAVRDYHKSKTKFWRKISASIFSIDQAPQFYPKSA
jgi:hypothetical protein